MRVVPKEKRREGGRRKCDQSSLDSGRRKKRVRHTHVRTLQFPESFDKWPAGPFKRGLITLVLYFVQYSMGRTRFFANLLHFFLLN